MLVMRTVVGEVSSLPGMQAKTAQGREDKVQVLQQICNRRIESCTGAGRPAPVLICEGKMEWHTELYVIDREGERHFFGLPIRLMNRRDTQGMLHGIQEFLQTQGRPVGIGDTMELPDGTRWVITTSGVWLEENTTADVTAPTATAALAGI